MKKAETGKSTILVIGLDLKLDFYLKIVLYIPLKISNESRHTCLIGYSRHVHFFLLRRGI